MKILFGIAASLAFATAAWSQSTVAEIKWPDIATTPPGTTLVTLDNRSALRIENTNDLPLQLSLLTIEKPKITAQTYAVQGEVRYDAAHGGGFLEMWSYFPPAQPGLPERGFFSRTLGESGEMGKIRGTSNWRAFSLPFDRTGTSEGPTRLKLNLVLGGRGTVYISAMKLVQFPATAAVPPRGREWFFGQTGHPWWSNTTSIWINSAGGVLLGCLGGLIGILAKKGKGRAFVLAVFKVQIVLGVAFLSTGIIAFAGHQPYAVWYPLLLGGVLLPAISAPMLANMGKCYQERELRRMQSLDVS